MPDEYASKPKEVDGPGYRHFAITPSANELPYVARAIVWITTGDATIVDWYGQSEVYTAMPAGFTLILRATKVTAATATLKGLA